MTSNPGTFVQTRESRPEEEPEYGMLHTRPRTGWTRDSASTGSHPTKGQELFVLSEDGRLARVNITERSPRWATHRQVTRNRNSRRPLEDADVGTVESTPETSSRVLVGDPIPLRGWAPVAAVLRRVELPKEDDFGILPRFDFRRKFEQGSTFPVVNELMEEGGLPVTYDMPTGRSQKGLGMYLNQSGHLELAGPRAPGWIHLRARDGALWVVDSEAQTIHHAQSGTTSPIEPKVLTYGIDLGKTAVGDEHSGDEDVVVAALQTWISTASRPKIEEWGALAHLRHSLVHTASYWQTRLAQENPIDRA